MQSNGAGESLLYGTLPLEGDALRMFVVAGTKELPQRLLLRVTTELTVTSTEIMLRPLSCCLRALETMLMTLTEGR